MRTVLLIPVFLLLPALPCLADDTLQQFADEALADRQPAIERALQRRGVEPSGPGLKDRFAILAGDGWEQAELPALREQIEEAAHFASDFYVDALGTTGALPLSEIAIVPLEKTGRRKPLTLRGRRLILGLAGTEDGGREVVSRDELREAWDSGSHLAARSPLRAYWAFYNPVGEFRTGILMELLQAASRLAPEIRKVEATKDDAFADRARALIEKFLPTGDAEKEKVGQWSIPQLREVLANWRSALARPDVLGEVVEAATQKAIEAQSSQEEIDVELDAPVAYGNYHRIDVRLESGSRARDLVEAKPNQRKVRVRATGKIFAGFTIDDISVSVKLDGSLERFALRTALGTLLR